MHSGIDSCLDPQDGNVWHIIDLEPRMLSYRHVTTFHKGSGYWQASIADLEFMTVNGRPILAAASELIGGGITLYNVPNANRPMEQASGWGYRTDFVYQQSPDMTVVQLGSQTYLHLSHIGRAEPLGMGIRPHGTLGGFQQILPQEEAGTGFSSLGQISLSGGGLIYASHQDGLSLTVFHVNESQPPIWASEQTFDRPGLHEASSLDKVIDAKSGGDRFLIAVSGLGDFVSTHRITDSGEILDATVHYTRAGTGITVPNDLCAIELAGKTFIVVAAQGSSSLTVFRLQGDGLLVPVDHVIDEGFTSFQSISAFDVVTFQGRPFIFAGGADGGITVFTLQPDGKLLHLQTIADDFEMVLSDISDIEASVIGGRIALFASSVTDAGITQLSFNPGTIGSTGAPRGKNVIGGAHNDMLFSRPETHTLHGGRGDDILIAQYAGTALTGGEGQDIFVPHNVDGRIVIGDFELGKDQLDLSQLGLVRSLHQIDFHESANAIQLRFHDTNLVIHTKTGRALKESDFTNDLFPIAHYTPPKIVRDRVDPDTRVSDKGEHIFGSYRPDTLAGGKGPDFILARAGNDKVNAGSGNDTVRGAAGNDTLTGDSGDDLILGSFGHDELRGGHGNDRIIGGDGHDTLNGGDGADLLEGEAMQDVLWGFQGNDTLEGGPGNDRGRGGRGDDLIIGGNGRDVLQGGSGNDTLSGGAMDDVITGEEGSDNLSGNDGRDRLIGGTGNDTVSGGAWHDTLSGLTGHDRLFGEAGNDTLSGGSGQDTLDGGSGRDALYGDVGADHLQGRMGDDTLFGMSDNDVLYGQNGHDHLAGGSGHDTVFGGFHSDRLSGDRGNDILDGGPGSDSVLGGDGNDSLRGDAGNDVFNGGVGSDTIEGHSGHDRMFGSAGRDILNAGSGNDTVAGGEGQDRLTGGMGRDVFVFANRGASPANAADMITDFVNGQDLIDVSNLNLSYIGRKGFRDDHQLRWDHQARNTHITADLNGDGRADLKIILTGHIKLTADDFIF